MWSTFKNIVTSIVVIQATFICTSFGQTLYDGSACVFRGSKGICRDITECPSIIADVTARRLSYSDMVSCGFKGKNPIICCPDNIIDRVDTSTSTTTEEIFTFDHRRERKIPSTIVTSNNLTIPSSLPFIDLTKLLKGRDNSTSNNRIVETGRGLKDGVEWIQPGTVKNELQNINVDPLDLNNELFKGDTNSLESEEGSTAKSTFDPNDPFSIYAFRGPEETVERNVVKTTTVRTIREAPRGFTSRNPSSNHWVWESSNRNTKPHYPFSFPLSSFPSTGTRKTTTTTTTTTTSTTTPRNLPMRRVGTKASEACTRYSKDAAAPFDFQILGGVPAAPGEFPHMAAFGYNDISGTAWNCAGSLISERYVLTAAHCVARRTNMPTIIRLGKTTLDTDDDAAESVDIGIADIIRHPDYVASQNYHDIALIRLNRDAPLGLYIRPACLYSDEKDNPTSDVLVATGWGTVNPDTREKSNILLKVNLTIVELDSCNQTHVSLGLDRRLRNGLNLGQMCAFMQTKDTCEGDSGGPLQVMDTYKVSTVVGITSFGLSCGANVPSVYSRVAYYLDWIESTVWPS